MKRTLFLLLVYIFFCTHFVFTEEAPDFDSVYKILAEKLAAVEKRLPNNTIAVYGFDVIGRPGDSFGRYATEKLTHEIVNEGSLLVIERSRIDEVLKEQSLSVSDIVDAGTAARIGKILAVDAVIIGTILVTDERTEFIVRAVQSERGIILSSVAEYVSIKTEETQSHSLVLRTNKKIYTSKEKIVIEFSGLPGNEADWITLVEASASDEYYGLWFYTDGAKSGTHTFNAVSPGNYELRLYFDWPAGGYIVQKRIAVTVK